MQARVLCKLLGAHEYENIREYDLLNRNGDVIGKAIVSKCKHCGKLKTHKIDTVSTL